MLFGALALLFSPTDLIHVKAQWIANDRVIRCRRRKLRLELRLPVARCARPAALQITRLLGPPHLVAFRRQLKDRFDLYGYGLLLRNPERVMRGIGVVVLVQESIRRAARMRQ